VPGGRSRAGRTPARRPATPDARPGRRRTWGRRGRSPGAGTGWTARPGGRPRPASGGPACRARGARPGPGAASRRGRPMSPPRRRMPGVATMPPSSTSTSGRRRGRSGEVLRGWVPSMTTVPSPRCSLRSRASVALVSSTTSPAPRTSATSRDARTAPGPSSATSAVSAVSVAAVRPTSSRSGMPARASSRVTAEPPDPVASTRAMPRPRRRGQRPQHGLGGDRGGDGVAVGHPDVGARTEQRPAAGRRRRQRAEPGEAAAGRCGPVDGRGDPPVGQPPVTEQLPGRERHAHDPAGGGVGALGQCGGGQGERGQREVAEGPLEGGDGHPAQRRDEPADLGGDVGAGVDQEGDGDGELRRGGHGCGP